MGLKERVRAVPKEGIKKGLIVPGMEGFAKGVSDLRTLGQDIAESRRVRKDPLYQYGDDKTLKALVRFKEEWEGQVVVPDEVISSFRDQPLDEETQRALILVGIVETKSINQFSNAISAGIARHPALRHFLVDWAAEELDHGQLFTRIIAECQGIPTDEASRGIIQPEEMPEDYYDRLMIEDDNMLREMEFFYNLSNANLFDEYDPVPSFSQKHSGAIVGLSSLVIPNFPAVYATFGAVQENTVVRAYELLQRSANDDRLDIVLPLITAQEKRHFRLYYAFAKYYLETDPLVQRIVGGLLKHQWKPVGYEAMGGENWKWLLDYLCPTDEDLSHFRSVDQTVQKLPGQARLTIMDDAINKARHSNFAQTPQPTPVG